MDKIEVTQAPINMNALVLQCEAASERDKMWHRRWKALRAMNYHNTNFSDQDGAWTLADFISYAGEVCGFQPESDERDILVTRTDATPVAWMYELPEENVRKFYQTRFPIKVPGWTEVPLYPHPPATDVAALVEPLESLIRFHESGGHAGDGSDENLTACKASIAALAPFTKGQNDD